MIDVTKVVYTVPVAPNELPMTETWRARVKAEIVERSRAVFGDNQEVDMRVVYRPIPGFNPKVAYLAVFIMTKADYDDPNMPIDAEVVE